MATRLPVGPFRDETYPAAADLSTYQYHIVGLSSGAVNVVGSGGVPLGILQNAPASGEQAVVRTLGQSFCDVSAASAISEGSPIEPTTNGVGIISATNNRRLAAVSREALASGTGTIVVDVVHGYMGA